MPIAISYITIKANDFERMLHFYQKAFATVPMKLPSKGMAVLYLDNVRLVLLDSAKFDAELQVFHNGQEDEKPKNIFSVNMDAPDAVRDFFAQLPSAAQLVQTPEMTTANGFRGYFADPEQNMWEIVFNPAYK